ncbi:BRO-N domain-containing protein [Enterobacter roggenkampii]|jgi:prophage antirepressor-like protein|uniref:BRO-N domain-containing protein n=1 Tax=Enterobacter roggenkampii TaxID=1812935 RepID=UPI001C7013BF|nr:BRO family protein [Enterobacter roggenkampii]MBW9438414.1 hypothetical protein [Enterobacter roggenkampii]DAV55913.1 MAG TPA: antirepressor [Caudoviricetes sp.]
MNSLATSDFRFQDVELHPVERSGNLWFSSSDLAKALGYKKTDAVTQIYSRYSDEFAANMSTTLRERVVRKTGAVEMVVRFFSLRGAHLVAMFASTPKAKEFRRWVLDVLDRELANGNVSPAFNFEIHAHNAKVALDYAEFIYQHWCEEIRPSLSLVGSPLANSLNERIKVLASITYGLNSGLAKAAKEKGMIH